jgi:hypothetical protein
MHDKTIYHFIISLLKNIVTIYMTFESVLIRKYLNRKNKKNRKYLDTTLLRPFDAYRRQA